MRISSFAVGLAFVVAACGGEKQAANQSTTTTPPADQPAAPAPAAAGSDAPAPGGANHDVNMVLEGTTYKYVPNTLTAKPGDVITFHSVSGGAHNVQFYPDSIPANVPPQIKALAVAPLEAGGSLVNESLKTEGESFQLSLKDAPTGTYHFFCGPHHALGMVGVLTVQ
ncbi:MAG TPA: plastocyanin/azurin family copper-binding protein [Gemmatimonadales bacterium]|nr:plastocyanin/azurin family copper-binding protein [Gemmatimonadales bacterium]